MKIFNNVVPTLAAIVLFTVAPLAGAWNLVNQINAETRPLPGGSIYDVVASGSASAYVTGVSLYPGNVQCRTGSSCLFGPIAYAQGHNGLRTIAVMGCTSSYNCGANITDTNVPVSTNMTWDEAITRWSDYFGGSLSRTYGYLYSIQPGWTAKVCAAWGTYSTTMSFTVLPGTDSCAPAPIPPNKCDVSGGDLTLDHGSLQVGGITGSKKEATRQMTCQRAASLRFIVSTGANPVDLGNGINSLITINGTAAGQTINLPAGVSTLRIASTLIDKGATPGAFSKTIVLIQSFI